MSTARAHDGAARTTALAISFDVASFSANSEMRSGSCQGTWSPRYASNSAPTHSGRTSGEAGSSPDAGPGPIRSFAAGACVSGPLRSDGVSLSEVCSGAPGSDMDLPLPPGVRREPKLLAVPDEQMHPGHDLVDAVSGYVLGYAWSARGTERP